MKALLVLSCVVLAGCCKPTVIKEPIEVLVPVATPCVDKPVDKPKWALDAVSEGSSVFDRVTAALFEIEQRRQYERELEAVLAPCVKPTPVN